MASKKKINGKSSFSDNKKMPANVENPDGYLKMHPVWAFRQCDTEYERWTITKSDNFLSNIFSKLVSYEGLTWAEIQSASGGKSSGTNNHFEYICEMIPEARKRADSLKLDCDQLFSLRLTGQERLYGILLGGVFNIIWYDANHEIYPSKKK